VLGPVSLSQPSLTVLSRRRFVCAAIQSHVVGASNDIVLGFLLVAGSFWMLAEKTCQFGLTAFEAAVDESLL